MADIAEKKTASSDDQMPVSPETSRQDSPSHLDEDAPKKTFAQKLRHEVFTAGSVLQIIIAALLAVAIGMAVVSTVDDIPEAVSPMLMIPGDLWLRALRAVVLPLIITAMILAVQSLKEMTGTGKKLAWWTILWYVLTTFIAIVQSCIMVSQVWRPLMSEVPAEEAEQEFASEEQKQEYQDRGDREIHEIVVEMFRSFISKNIVESLASNHLLAVIIVSIVIGYLIQGPSSQILKLVKEIEKMVSRVITFLIKCAPIGVFFLILANLFRLDIQTMGENLGIFIAGAICDMGIHLFVVLPILFFAFTRANPYSYWLKNSKAWITAWGTASSAATLPVTLRCAKARGIPNTVAKFALPLGATINMDGTAIYFPVVVVFMAATQGINLNAADYVLICLLSTLASIGTTPIPSSSLVLTVLIADAVGVPVSGTYAVVVAIDWFLDRFRTATNVSGDLFAAAVVAKQTGVVDPDDYVEDEDVGQIRSGDATRQV